MSEHREDIPADGQQGQFQPRTDAERPEPEGNPTEAEKLRVRLVNGQKLLTARHDELMGEPDAGVGSSREAGFLDALWGTSERDGWETLEQKARIYGLRGCIHAPGPCPDDAVVRCMACDPLESFREIA